MAKLYQIRFLLFVSLMILPAHTLDVIFSSADKDFKQKSEINTYIQNGRKIYSGTLRPLTYRPKPDTSNVIVYIIDKSRFVEIVRNAARETRLQIARELSEWRCELVLLGIDDFDDNEYYLISGFIDDKIKPRQNEPNCTIVTIGENHFDRVYHRTMLGHVLHVEKYQENAQICGGALQAHLRNIPRGALRPVGRNGKEIKLYGFHPPVKEMAWSVYVVNNIYVPQVNVSDQEYNFRMKYKTKKICLLILRGKEYSAVTCHGKRAALKVQTEEIMHGMKENNEALFVLGVFNFDWTEIDILTQIILQHSVGWHSSCYNVFTCGYGMFNTKYRNVFGNDGRNILPQPKTNVTEMIKVLMGKEVKERAIKMYFASYGWKELEMPIRLENGQYVAAGRFQNYTFPWVNQKIAFIVYDATEKNVPIDIRMVFLSMEELKQSGIYVVGIEAINFGLDDMHIIAEWIDYHRGVYMENSDREVIDSEQIAVLGGGIFDTLFQSRTTTYNTLFNTKKNDLERIRSAFVKSSNGKSVSVAKFFNPKFEVCTYQIDTVNGFHEPDLIPDQNMFDNRDRKNIYFIATTANRFHHIATIENTDPVSPWLKKKFAKYYPYSEWSVFLVGLDNFEERDYHLFAELVKIQTHNEKSLSEFVLAYNYDIGYPAYQYKDTPPFTTETRFVPLTHVKTFFDMACGLTNLTRDSSSH